MEKHKVIAFTLIKAFGNSVSTAVKLDAYDVEYTTGKARSLCLKLPCYVVDDVRHALLQRIHLAFIPATGLRCSCGKISIPLTEIPVGKTEISGNEPARPLI